MGLRVRSYEGSGVRLVQLRNPWGKFEWRGDWSDKSTKWTDALKKAVRACASALIELLLLAKFLLRLR